MLDGESLDLVRQDAGLTHDQLWLRCFALGGDVPPLELEGVLLGALTPDRDTWNLIAHALNERLDEIGRSQRVTYDDPAV